jgi:hypothetical protein
MSDQPCVAGTHHTLTLKTSGFSLSPNYKRLSRMLPKASKKDESKHTFNLFRRHKAKGTGSPETKPAENSTTEVTPPSGIARPTSSSVIPVNESPQTITAIPRNVPPRVPDPSAPKDADTINSTEMYESAKRKLKEALKIRRDDWESFEFSELDSLSEQRDTSVLQGKIDKILALRKQSIKDPKGWSKCKAIMENAFLAFSPFAKNVLGVAVNASAVNRNFVSRRLTIDCRIESIWNTIQWASVIGHGIILSS